VLAAGVFSGIGCGRTAAPPATVEPASANNATCNLAENWCVEHGVPEDICALCNAKVAAQCKQKGDWCPEHNRPESQCFVCNPQRRAKFAAEYQARYGTKPPAPGI
jgi:hypothetical protein